MLVPSVQDNMLLNILYSFKESLFCVLDEVLIFFRNYLL